MPARIEEQLKKFIRRNFNASFMSNTKWKKLFIALEPLEIAQAYWKFVDLDEEFLDLLVSKHDLMDKFIGESGLRIGPCAYRRIEWIEIPHIGKDLVTPNVPFLNFEQNTKGIVPILNEIGKFELRATDRGIRIYGYK